MNERITFSQLEQVLADLGFRKTVVPETGVAYAHKGPKKAVIVVRFHKPSDLVPDYALFGVKHDLEVFGIIEPSAFEEMLKTVAA